MSMQKLLDLEADILCEGHSGIFQPGHQVRQYMVERTAISETPQVQNKPLAKG